MPRGKVYPENKHKRTTPPSLHPQISISIYSHLNPQITSSTKPALNILRIASFRSCLLRTSPFRPIHPPPLYHRSFTMSEITHPTIQGKLGNSPPPPPPRRCRRPLARSTSLIIMPNAKTYVSTPPLHIWNIFRDSLLPVEIPAAFASLSEIIVTFFQPAINKP